jgi:hypothetical protein
MDITTVEDKLQVHFYDLELLPNGIYFVQVVGENGTQKTIQVVK